MSNEKPTIGYKIAGGIFLLANVPLFVWVVEDMHILAVIGIMVVWFLFATWLFDRIWKAITGG